MKKEVKDKIKYETLDWLKAIIYAVIFGTIIRLFVFETMMVPTPSMVPAIQEQDRMFVEKITYSFEEPDTGDVVVFWTPFIDNLNTGRLRFFDKFMDFFSADQFDGHVRYVKRLVGKPGDIITLKNVPNSFWENIEKNGSENLPYWVKNLVDYYEEVKFIPTRIKEQVMQVQINGVTPEEFQNIYYTKDAVFDDDDFWKYMAYPEKYSREIYNSDMSMVYKGNFQNESIIQNVDLSLNFFESYNNAFAYSQTYEELYSDINLDEYVYTENGQVHIKVPEGFYYFMGDNSMESLDSRFFGFVPKENIIGTLFLRIYPFERFGKIN